jgi:hypothetical protein
MRYNAVCIGMLICICQSFGQAKLQQCWASESGAASARHYRIGYIRSLEGTDPAAYDSCTVVRAEFNSSTMKETVRPFKLGDSCTITDVFCDRDLTPQHVFPPVNGPKAPLKDSPEVKQLVKETRRNIHIYQFGRSCLCKENLRGVTGYVCTAPLDSVSQQQRAMFKVESLFHFQALWNMVTNQVTVVDSTSDDDETGLLKGFFAPSGTKYYYEKHGKPWEFDIATGKRTLLAPDGYPAVASNNGDLLVYSRTERRLTVLDSEKNLIGRIENVNIGVPLISAVEFADHCYAIGSYVKGNGMGYGINVYVADIVRKAIDDPKLSLGFAQLISAERIH